MSLEKKIFGENDISTRQQTGLWNLWDPAGCTILYGNDMLQCSFDLIGESNNAKLNENQLKKLNSIHKEIYKPLFDIPLMGLNIVMYPILKQIDRYKNNLNGYHCAVKLEGSVNAEIDFPDGGLPVKSICDIISMLEKRTTVLKSDDNKTKPGIELFNILLKALKKDKSYKISKPKNKAGEPFKEGKEIKEMDPYNILIKLAFMMKQSGDQGIYLACNYYNKLKKTNIPVISNDRLANVFGWCQGIDCFSQITPHNDNFNFKSALPRKTHILHYQAPFNIDYVKKGQELEQKYKDKYNDIEIDKFTGKTKEDFNKYIIKLKEYDIRSYKNEPLKNKVISYLKLIFGYLTYAFNNTNFSTFYKIDKQNDKYLLLSKTKKMHQIKSAIENKINLIYNSMDFKDDILYIINNSEDYFIKLALLDQSRDIDIDNNIFKKIFNQSFKKSNITTDYLKAGYILYLTMYNYKTFKNNLSKKFNHDNVINELVDKINIKPIKKTPNLFTETINKIENKSIKYLLLNIGHINLKDRGIFKKLESIVKEYELDDKILEVVNGESHIIEANNSILKLLNLQSLKFEEKMPRGIGNYSKSNIFNIDDLIV